MSFKPLPIKKYQKYIDAVNWRLDKGSIDWNLYNDKGDFICSIIVSHGKNSKSEITAYSVHKTRKNFEERGLKWPPNLK